MADERMHDEEELRPERLGRRLRVSGSITALPELPEVEAGRGWHPSAGGAGLLRAFRSREEADAYFQAVQEAVLPLDPPSGPEDGRYLVMLLLSNLYLAEPAGAKRP